MLINLPTNLEEVLLTLSYFNGLVLIVGFSAAGADRNQRESNRKDLSVSNVARIHSVPIKVLVFALFSFMAGLGAYDFLTFVLQRGWILQISETPTGIIVMATTLSVTTLSYTLWRTKENRQRKEKGVSSPNGLYELIYRLIIPFGYMAAITTLFSLALALVGAVLYPHYTHVGVWCHILDLKA